MQVLFQFTVEEHLLAGGAFVPEIVGNVILPDEGSDLGSDEFGEPAHIDLMGVSIRQPGARRLRTPPDNWRVNSRTFSTSSGVALPSAVRLSAMVCTMADPTTAGVGDFGHAPGLVRRLDAETDCHRQVGVTFQARDSGMNGARYRPIWCR